MNVSGLEFRPEAPETSKEHGVLSIETGRESIQLYPAIQIVLSAYRSLSESSVVMEVCKGLSGMTNSLQKERQDTPTMLSLS